jgi:predicted methyltransferase
MTEPAKKKRAKSETAEQRSTVLIAQVSWCAHARGMRRRTKTARQVVADLYAHLSRGGTVSVRIEGLEGSEHTIEVSARR